MVGLDVLDSPFTSVVGSITDRAVVRRCLVDVTGVLHAATLHKPHIASHDRQAFIDTNISGTLVLLEEAVAAGVASLRLHQHHQHLRPGPQPHRPGAPAAWITEDVVPVPRNVYGVTKTAAEDLCALAHRTTTSPSWSCGPPASFPRPMTTTTSPPATTTATPKPTNTSTAGSTSRTWSTAHLLALDRAPAIGFARYVISATTPFTPDDTADAGRGRRAPSSAGCFPIRRPSTPGGAGPCCPGSTASTSTPGPGPSLGWTPRHDFRSVLDRLKADEDPRSALARAIGAKGYHRAGPDG